MALDIDLDTLLAQLTTSNSASQVNNLFKSIPAEAREVILASTLASGQDPLSVLDVRSHTVGLLYILSARVSVNGATPPPWQVVDDFCRNFDPVQARFAPDRVILLGKNLPRLATYYNNPAAAILPLRILIQRYVPDSSYLTALHPTFVLTCVSARRFTDALPILTKPITNVDATDMQYTDNLIYHYAGGIALAALKRWSEAEDFFETCVTSPGFVPSAIQLEALKKMRLVQLISRGKVSTLPKYTLPNLTRLFKTSPYQTFLNNYPHNVEGLKEIAKKERQTFTTEKNIGLINQAIDRAPRWALKRLIGTYVTLNLPDIARAIKIDSIDQVREMLLNMIESNEISAQISSNGTVTFSDPVPDFTKAQVDSLLREVQTQSATLTKLDLDVGKSKDYLAKAVRLRESAGGDWMPGEELMSGTEGAQVWAEEAMYS